MRIARVLAPAKVNLLLRVLDRRSDGYHDVVTLFQAVDLSDEVSVEIADTDGPIELKIDGPELGPMADNLAARAARAYREATGSSAGVRIALMKNIPAGAGLGGGSSDAAAVLRCLAELTGDDDRARLARIAEGLGSDVPFLLGPSSLAVGTGRGEILTPIEPLPPRDLVIAMPSLHVATATAYARLADHRVARADGRSGDGDRSAAADVGLGSTSTASDELIDLLSGEVRWSLLDPLMHNDFEGVVPEQHPEIARSLTALRAVGGTPVLLSGSGGASFGFFDGRGGAERAADKLSAQLGWPCVAARTLTAFPGPTVHGPGEA